MTTYSNAFFGIPENDHRFNLAAAVDAYEWVMGHPGEARFVLSKCLYDHVPKDMEYHKPVIDKAVNAFISKQLEDAKRGIARNIIAKSENGEDTAAIGSAVMVIEAISKAYGDDYSPSERRLNAERQNRDPLGRFQVMSRKIKPNALKQAVPDGADGAKPAGLGVPASGRMSPDQRRKFQNDYMQVRNALNDAMGEAYGSPEDHSRMLVQAKRSDGSSVVVPFDVAQEAAEDEENNNNGLVTATAYRANKPRVTEIKVFNERPEGAGPGFDTIAAMSNPRFAAMAGAFDSEFPAMTENWTERGKDDYRTNDQFWRRMGSASQLAAAVGAPYLPPSATMALQAGKWIGDMAPEAEKVLGPAARKAAYRYRGTEKKPDENWQKGINALRREFEDEEQAGRKAHDAMIKGRINPETKRQQDSAVISNFKKILTDASRYKLNLASGSVPPSQGIIIDRKGQVITEAVGYGEDWYLPFDLKNLNKLDGGEYIRTRAYGGPTTEDVLVGLVSGARAVTVVSHSGVFTIEFDDTFRGSRRYNDKAGRMQDRYASLLDAVKSRRVSVGDIPKSRRDEIDAEAAEKVDPADNPKLFKEEQRKLLDQEYENPKLSQAMKDNIAYPLLNDYAVERGAGNWEQYLGKLERDPKKREIYEAFKTPNLVEAAQRAGLGEQYKRDEADKLATYAVELSPLNLNGRGYHQAMQALKDQFPYYIKDVHFSGGVQKEDWGYVKPRYIRPEKALAGYFDPSITGQGKISADRTVYQNYTQEAKRGVADGPSSGNSRGDWTREPAEEDTGAGSSAGSAKPAAPRTEAQVDKLIAQIKALRSQKNFAAEIAEVEEEEDTPEYYLQQGLAGRVQSDETKKMIADQFGWDFLTNDVDDIEAALYAGGVNSPEYRRLRNKVDEAFDSGMYDIGPDDVDPTPAGALQPRPSNVSAMLRVFPALESGARFDFADVAPGENLTYYKYRIDNLVGGSKSLKSAGITSSSPLADIMDAVHARAEELKAEMVKYNAGRGDLSEDEVKREATAMAKVTQAAMLRDEIEPPSRTAPKKVASTPFASAPSEEEGATEEDDEPEVAEEEDEEEVESVPDLVARLKNTVGMKKVADEAGRVVSRAVWDQQEGGGRSATRHIVFTGNPGTGKSMVANMIAPLYYKLGVTSSPEITILKREDLVDIYKDGTAAKARAALERGKGGVIFIDEAHQLQNSDTDSGGKEALQVLVPFSTENKDDTVIILAGYGPGIHNLYRADDGLESRFPNTVHFDNYSADSLKQITSDWFEKDNFVLDPGATQHVQIAMKQIADRPNTANARDADTLYNKIIDAHAQRVQEQNIPQGDPRRRKITKIDAEMGMLAAGLTPPRPKKYK